MDAHPRLLMIPAVLMLAAPGCGERWEAETHPASGRVSVNGKPAAGTLVQLHSVGKQPDERNSRPWGLAKDDGTFSLSTYAAGDGAPAGSYAVTITWPDDPSVPSMTDRLGFRYSDPGRSLWKVTIRDGENTLPPIEVVDARVDAPKPTRPRSPVRGPEMLGVNTTPPGKTRP